MENVETLAPVEGLPRVHAERVAAPGAAARAAVARFGQASMARAVPPLLVLAVLVGIWELLGSRPGSSLPSAEPGPSSTPGT